ncbi:MAG: SRPBCC family protein [Saprospiraceae bacterium]
MWTKTYSIETNEVTKEQMWKLFSEVNQWHLWDKGIEYAKIEGKFEKGNTFLLKPKGGPKVKIELVEALENRRFTDYTKFPLAEMYGEHTFEETSKGLKITTTMKVKGLLGFLWVKLVAKGIADGLPVEMKEQLAYASKL